MSTVDRAVSPRREAPSTRREWAARISAAWQQSVTSIIETGRLLIEAKDALDHGEWLPMIETDLPFKPSTAQRLMKIADDERLTNAAHVQHLPPAWGTLYELTKLEDDVFKQKLRDGTINPEMQRKDVGTAKRGKKVSAIDALSACDHDPEDSKMINEALETELAMQDFDRLAKFKRRIVNPEGVWVCEQLERAWHALRSHSARKS